MAAKKTKTKKPQGRKVRSLRHWKQQFDPSAVFIWRRATVWEGESFEPGDLIPEKICQQMGRNKLRRFWESSWIELAEFDEPQNIAASGLDPAVALARLDGEGDGDEGQVEEPAEPEQQLELPLEARNTERLRLVRQE